MNNYEVLATEIGFVSAFATVTYDEAGVLWIDGVPVMGAPDSDEECDGLYGYRDVADDDTNFNAAKYSGSVNLVAPYIDVNSPF